MAAESPPRLSRIPLLALTAGLVLLLVHAAIARVPGLPLIRELTLFAGSALVVVGVVRRLRTAGWDWRDRVETAAYVSAAGAVTGGMAAAGLNEAWGSARLLFAVASLFAFGATVLILLPPAPRKVLLSLWVIFHFGGMFTSFSSIDPPGNQGPFLPKQLWTYVYRPYLSFLYMTNAYHFYSPDPGPPALLWFAVHYTDGKYVWVRIPNREKGQISMHYQRLLALPEHSFSPNTAWPLTQAQVDLLPREQKQLIDDDRIWDNIQTRRVIGSKTRYAAQGHYIPVPSDLDPNVQYREPNETSKRLIAAVAQRVFEIAPKREGCEVKSVKAYRVTHQILTPYEVAKGTSPFEKNKYWPFFLGEFDADGEMLDPRDPFLYWYIPVVKVPKKFPNHGHHDPLTRVPMLAVRAPEAEPNFLLDGLEMHAGGPASAPVPVPEKEKK